MFFGSSNGRLQVYEIATPETLRLSATTPVTGGRNAVVGSFLYNSTGAVVDLPGGTVPPVLNNTSGCVPDFGTVGETLVQAQGTSMRVFDMDPVTDRNLATTFSLASHTYTVNLPSPRTAHAIASAGNHLAGNHLVVVGDRSDGTWLDFYDARKIRDGLVGTSLAATDTLGAYQVATARGRTSVTLHHGRALVTG